MFLLASVWVYLARILQARSLLSVQQEANVGRTRQNLWTRLLMRLVSSSKGSTSVGLERQRPTRNARNGTLWSDAVSDPSRELVGFYSDTGPDNRGRFLREMQNWSDDQLERTHDYIQWLFPLAEPSGFNLNAPILNAYTINRFRSDADLRRRLQTSLVRMLAFYGLEMRTTVPLSVAFAESFPERAKNWLTRSNHNHLRITRILKSLCLLGLEEQASAFFRFLEVLYKMESTGPEPRISLETFGYWRSAVDPD
jgi:hypothetical protein